MSAHEDHPYYHAHHFHTMEQQNASLKWYVGIPRRGAILLRIVHGLYIHAILLSRNVEMVQRKTAQHSVGSNQHIVLLTSSLTMALAVRAAQMLPMEKKKERFENH